ncbi:MAG: dienelactone hydrolase family protein [Pseudomonadales bacterium]
MIELEIDISGEDGEINTFIAYPDEGGPYPIVLLLMDAPGIRPELKKMATRLATSGYCVILPNLYYRKSRDANFTDREQMVEYMDSLSNALVLQDCQTLLAWCDQQPFAAAGPAGVVGYCMSGPFAFYTAARLGNRIKAGASIHGVRLMTEAEHSPHLGAAQIQGEFYIGCAQTDHWAPVEMINRLQQYIAPLPSNIRIEWYPETEHGFVFPERAGKYHHNAAERHWQRLLAMFARNLQVAA